MVGQAGAWCSISVPDTHWGPDYRTLVKGEIMGRVWLGFSFVCHLGLGLVFDMG